MKTNAIIEKLNAAGYKNEGTNRQRVVRNLNLLIDAGVLDIKFIDADLYNAKEGGKAYIFTASNGKKYCTPYIVILFGKKYYGDFIKRVERKKYKSHQNIPGVWEYGIDTTYYNNSTLNLSDIMMRVAKLISITKGEGDFMKETILAKHGKCSCAKCDGLGHIPAFSYYANGVCFDCGGLGIDRNTLKTHIKESINLAKN